MTNPHDPDPLERRSVRHLIPSSRPWMMALWFPAVSENEGDCEDQLHEVKLPVCHVDCVPRASPGIVLRRAAGAEAPVQGAVRKASCVLRRRAKQQGDVQEAAVLLPCFVMPFERDAVKVI